MTMCDRCGTHQLEYTTLPSRTDPIALCHISTNQLGKKMSIFIRRSIALSALIILSGCAMWPSIKSADELEPNNIPEKGCLKLNLTYSQAQNCAHQTLNEIDGMIDDTGHFDRGLSYVVVGLASAAGAAIGFGSSVDTLKGLGIASGSLLGINTIVDTSTQRSILVKGRRQLDCVIRAADALYTAANVPSKNRLSIFAKEFKAQASPVFSASINSFATPFYKLWQHDQTKVYSLIAAKGEETTLSKSLITQYLSIISVMKEELASSVKQPNFNEQKDRVSQMIGDIRKAQADANNVKRLLALLSPPTFDNSEQPEKPISEVFNDCASEAAKSMVNNP